MIQDSVIVVVVAGDILEVEEVATMEEIMTEAKKTVATNLGAIEVAGEGSRYGGRGRDSYSSLGSNSSSYGRKYGQGYSSGRAYSYRRGEDLGSKYKNVRPAQEMVKECPK